MNYMYTLTVISIVASNSCAEAVRQIRLPFILACVTGLLPLTGLLPPDFCSQVTPATNTYRMWLCRG